MRIESARKELFAVVCLYCARAKQVAKQLTRVMDDLNPLRTPKKRQSARTDISSPWHKGHLRQLSPFSPVGVRRRVSAEKDDEREDEGPSDVETHKLHLDGKVAHQKEHVVPTPRKDSLAGKKAAAQTADLSRSSTGAQETREISTQRHRSDDEKVEQFRLSNPSNKERTRLETFNKLSTSLREDILSHQRITSREAVGIWSTRRASPADADEMLCRFDVIPEYGPSCGISRRERRRLAEELGLDPPQEVMEALRMSRKDTSIFDQRLAKFGTKSPTHW